MYVAALAGSVAARPHPHDPPRRRADPRRRPTGGRSRRACTSALGTAFDFLFAGFDEAGATAHSGQLTWPPSSTASAWAAARRPVAVLIAWILVLGSVAAAMVSFQRPLTNEFELPNSEFAAVLDDLGEQIPEVAGGTGTVVLHSKDGFTPAQRTAIDATMAQWRTLPARHRHGRPVRDPAAARPGLGRPRRR